jgi:hypothetical protein
LAGLAGADSFLDEIEEINRFEENDVDDEEGVKLGFGDDI